MKINRYSVIKPVMGSQIEWGHPLSRGLIGAWLMNGKSVNRVENLVQPSEWLTMQAGATWGTGTLGGPALYLDGSSSGYAIAQTTYYNIAAPFTWVMCYRHLGQNTYRAGGASANWGFVLSVGGYQNGLGTDVGMSSAFDTTYPGQSSGRDFIIRSLSGSSATCTETSIQYSGGSVCRSGGTDGTNEFVTDMALTGTLGASGSPAYSSGQPALVGLGGGGGWDGAFNGLVEFLYCYNRALTVEERLQIALSPFSHIWRPGLKRIFVASSPPPPPPPSYVQKVHSLKRRRFTMS